MLLVGFGSWYFAIRSREPRNDHERFQGEWKLSIAGREKQMPVRVQVTGDKFVFLVGEQEQKRYTMTLRPQTDPKEIDLTQLLPDGSPVLERHAPDAPFSPVTLRGIYRFADGKATVVTAPNPQPRPTAFDSPNEEDSLPVWLLVRP
jgi:uncharacterized protein (TIGR03067 family)